VDLPLQKLSLKNFQAHANLTLDLKHPITTLVGRSDAGKSSIIRALYWLTFNQPRGDGCLRRGTKRVRVRLRVAGKTLVRQKGKGNTYTLDGHRLDAVGTTVPEPVSRALRLSPLNFQLQLDGPFWFDLSPGQVARELNKMANLDAMDRSQAWVSRRLRQQQAEGEVLQELRSEAQTAARRLRWVSPLSAGLKRLETQGQRLAGCSAAVDSLRVLLADAGRCQTRVSRANAALGAGKAAVRTAVAIATITDEIQEIRRHVSRARRAALLSRVTLPDVRPLITLDAEITHLTEMLGDVAEHNAMQAKLQTEIEMLRADIKKVKQPKVCPTCRRPLD